MAIKIAQGFKILSNNPIDERFVLTKQQMKDININTIPSNYFALCSEDNKIYVYNAGNSEIASTGKFRVLTAAAQNIIVGYYYDNNFYEDAVHSILCEKNTEYLYVDKQVVGTLYTWDGTNFNLGVPAATATTAGIAKLYNETGENIDGSITQGAATSALGNLQLDVENGTLVWSNPY